MLFSPHEQKSVEPKPKSPGRQNQFTLAWLFIIFPFVSYLLYLSPFLFIHIVNSTADLLSLLAECSLEKKCNCSNAYVRVLSHVQLFVTSRTVACQGPLSMELSRKENWNGLPFPSPGDLSDSGIEPQCPQSPALTGGFFTTLSPGKSSVIVQYDQKYLGHNCQLY